MWIDFVSAWLTSFGLAFMVSLTDGPFGVFTAIRRKVDSTKAPEWIRTGLQCPICVGFWISAATAFLIGGGIVMWLSSFGFICTVTSLSPDSPDDDD